MKLLAYLLLGWLLGSLAAANIGAQNAATIFGLFSGAPKAVSVDGSGNLNVAVN